MIKIVNVYYDECTLYIGRKWRGFEKSKWHNPYSARFGRFECLRLYEEFVRKHLWNDLHKLDGHVLGCWCHPKACHGDVLKRLRQEQLDAKIETVPAEHSAIQTNVGESN